MDLWLLLVVSLLLNVLMAYAVIVLTAAYLHARRFRDKWRDQATDTLAAWRSTLPATMRQDGAPGHRRPWMDA